MHGGAPGSAAPLGNKNALKHGRFTREQRAERQRVQELLRQSRKLLVDIMMSEPKNVAIGFVL
jgi:hypothetical protein